MVGGGGGGGGGVKAQLTEKALTLFLPSTYFAEGGRGSNFFQGGGGGVQSLIPIF